MLSHFRKSYDEKDRGFTLIELLVVMIIIGILAAIAIPVYVNQRKLAEDVAAKSDVATLGKELHSYYIDGTAVPTITIVGGNYTLKYGSPVVTKTFGKASKNVVLRVYSPSKIKSGTNWCVSVNNPKGDRSLLAKGGFSFSSTAGLTNAACP